MTITSADGHQMTGPAIRFPRLSILSVASTNTAVPAQQPPRQDYTSKRGNTIAVTKKESIGQGVTTGVRAVTRAVTAVTGAPGRSTGQGLRVRGCALCYRIRISDVLDRWSIYRPPDALWPPGSRRAGRSAAMGVGTSCKPFPILRCSRPTGYIGQCGNTITVTKREHWAGRYTWSHSSYTGCEGGRGRNSIGNSTVTPCNTDDYSPIHDDRIARQWMCWAWRCRTAEIPLVPNDALRLFSRTHDGHPSVSESKSSRLSPGGPRAGFSLKRSFSGFLSAHSHASLILLTFCTISDLHAERVACTSPCA
jgi:hypothetical protein